MEKEFNEISGKITESLKEITQKVGELEKAEFCYDDEFQLDAMRIHIAMLERDLQLYEIEYENQL